MKFYILTCIESRNYTSWSTLAGLLQYLTEKENYTRDDSSSKYIYKKNGGLISEYISIEIKGGLPDTSIGILYTVCMH